MAEAASHLVLARKWRPDRFGELVGQEHVTRTLSKALKRGVRIYSAAYIMPSPAFGHKHKHTNHLALIAAMMNDGLAAKVQHARSSCTKPHNAANSDASYLSVANSCSSRDRSLK